MHQTEACTTLCAAGSTPQHIHHSVTVSHLLSVSPASIACVCRHSRTPVRLDVAEVAGSRGCSVTAVVVAVCNLFVEEAVFSSRQSRSR